MRIIGGRWAGRDLVSPSGRVRPTAESVRVAIVELVEAELPEGGWDRGWGRGIRALDLFAGTGSVGIEFLSRGAHSCDFVEDHPSALHALKANVVGLRLPRNRTRVFRRDAIPFAEALGGGAGGPRDAGGDPPYDLAFADPPWGSKKLERVLHGWLARPFSRVLVLEHAADQPVEGLPAASGRRQVMDAMITVLRAELPAAPREP